MEDTILLKNFPSIMEAEIAKDILEKNGIKSGIQRGNEGASVEFVSVVGDANLFVLEKDLKKAKEILEEYSMSKE